MTKAELEAENLRQRERIAELEAAWLANTEAALIYKRRFDETLGMLREIPGLHSGPLWDKLQGILKKYELIYAPRT